ncbi:MAG: pantoate kinase [Candidatus Thermoplasmatota archaeon]|nr:pantoate kinase [Candidatus Thermoplasmatota archaeon]
MINASAFAPGHISGFFQPVFDPTNVYKTGSRGAGFSVTLGSTSQVTVEESKQQTIHVYLNDVLIDSPLITSCIVQLIGAQPLKIISKIDNDLPMSQGFGMSAAGVLSTSYALTSCLHLSLEDAVKAAHAAEVKLMTGLGDVLGSKTGGFEIRSDPGLPPWGFIHKIPLKKEMVLCIVDTGIDTKKVLTDEKQRSIIDVEGRICTDTLLEDPSLEHFFALSESFARRTGLANKSVIKAIDAAKTQGIVSMCMLGHSIFATGSTDKLVDILKDFGDVYVTDIDTVGARIIHNDEA